MNPNGNDPHLLTSGKWVALALGIILLFFGGLGIWSAWTQISGAVIALGTVSPESGIKTVQHPEGGVVRDILVHEGDKVHAGQPLLILDDSTLRANFSSINARLQADIAEMARLVAERDHARQIVFPGQFLHMANDSQTAQLMETQESLFLARRNMLASQQDVLKQKIRALEERMVGLREELKGKKKQSAYIAEEVSTVDALLKKGQALKPRLLALERTASALEGDRGRLLGELAQARESIAEIREQIIALKRDFLSRVLARLAELQKESAVLREQRADIAKKLEESEIRAPVDGRVLDLTVRTVGGVVAPRQPIMRIVPQDEPLIVDARVKVTDIDEVRPSGVARVIFSAFSSRTTPTLQGRVQMISPAPQIDPLKKQPFYQVKIVVPSRELKKLGPNKHLVPGMPAEVFITTRERSPLDIIVSPFFTAARRAFRH